MARLEGDIIVLGAGGKMGPSLTRLARRASDDAGVPRRVIAVSRFGDAAVATLLEQSGVEVLAGDLFDSAFVSSLPDARNVVSLVGHKFGTTDDPAATWATNAFLTGALVRRFRTANIVVLSTGNVYPLVPVDGQGSTESDALTPMGEYAQSAVARERIADFFAVTQGTRTAILRVNYAVELRYGVLRDLADLLTDRQPIDLTMGYVNVIWQRDANSMILRSLDHCRVPPLVLNVTAPEKLAVRDLIQRLGARLQIEPIFANAEGPTAYLSDASRAQELFGNPTLDVDTLLDWVAHWVQQGGRSLNQPTHFQERSGRF